MRSMVDWPAGRGLLSQRLLEADYARFNNVKEDFSLRPQADLDWKALRQTRW